MSKPIVQVRNITKKIGRKTIIDQLSFDVPQGEVFGLLGPNGAGKTTTIRMMVGLISITEGEILIQGHSIAKSFEQAIRHVGAIVENPEMYKYLSGYLNLVHYARMVSGVSEERIQEVVSLVGLQQRIHDKVKTYSLGMRQRLGVAQALLHRPSLLILDEPTNGLDPAGIRELRDYLRKLTREEGISVIVSSHLLSEMEQMCDRVAIIQQGKLIDVRLLKDYVGKDGKRKILFFVDEKARAIEVLAATNQEWQVESHPDGFILALAREDIAAVNSILVQAGVKIYGIKEITITLEDKFLEMTGGNTIA